MPSTELNLDGLVGPTHNYAGLSHGNLASAKHRDATSSPRQAALEGLAKMKLLADLGIPQAVIPPQDRPAVATLRAMGFSGKDAEVIRSAHRTDPQLLAACSSSSSMWAANAATVSPGFDSADGRVHFTTANLISIFHRSLEPPTISAMLHGIFPEGDHFAHHAPLPGASHFGDEGAANHTRLCTALDSAGIELFVYGRRGFDPTDRGGSRFSARQTLEASSAIARLHRLDPGRTLFIRQNPAAVDAGAFHNDVVAVGHQNVLLYHEQAFVDPLAALQIESAWSRVSHEKLHLLRISADALTLAEAVESYLFNSQIVSLPDGSLCLIAPADCKNMLKAKRYIDDLIASDSPIKSVRYVDVRQSMNNGGGPACLRLRVVLSAAQQSAMNASVLLTDRLHEQLVTWVTRHYRERLSADDLGDPNLLRESRDAMNELTQLLSLPGIYEFQR